CRAKKLLARLRVVLREIARCGARHGASRTHRVHHAVEIRSAWLLRRHAPSRGAATRPSRFNSYRKCPALLDRHTQYSVPACVGDPRLQEVETLLVERDEARIGAWKL